MTVAPRSADDAVVAFRLADRRHRLASVRLVDEIGLPGPLRFDRVPDGWSLDLDRPRDVDRMEYLLELEDHNGHRWTITDPDNPKRAPGAFGDKSVVEFDGYVTPAWTHADAGSPAGVAEREYAVNDAAMTVTVWAPTVLADGAPAPLVVVHDGPEFDALGGFTHYLGVQVAAGVLPPLRAALLDPGDRNAWYSAAPGYADALCGVVVPDLVADVAAGGPAIGVGVSLGALALLHAHRAHAGTFDALFLQSGSFFTPEHDAQESGFSGYAAVTEFVRSTHDAAPSDERSVPTVLTCGTVEENLANNVAMTATLQRLGYGARLHRCRDAHNFTAWRDALHPHLTDLIGAARAS